MSSKKSWGDPKLADETTKMRDWYKVVRSHRDVIRIASECATVYTHNWNENGFRISMCSREEHGSCPFCDKLANVGSHDRKMRWATTIYHLTRQAQGGNPVVVAKPLAWRFAERWKNLLMEINKIVSAGKRNISHVDLMVRLENNEPDSEKFQKLIIQHMPSNTIKDSPEIAKKLKLEATKEKMAELERLYLPTPEDLAKFIKDDDDSTSFNPQELDKGVDELPEEKDEEKASWGPDDDPLKGIELSA